ncbi:MAG: RNA-binding transcriptional accessory protein, partial [Spirochaetaceae bacterium]|nr:RNA-binding transcriptional accessory protein [Spirochaetaceae bacterium]
VPFIARYRKEKTGNLDEMQIREIDHLFTGEKNLEERRIEIIRLIFKQDKLTEPLYQNITGASTLAELEDIYTPYKRKKKTRAMLAIERGLEVLADAMQELDDAAIRAKSVEFISIMPEQPELSVATVEDALQGAMDIIAERIAQEPANRACVKSFFIADGRVIVKGIGTEEDKKTSVYQMYWDYTEQLSQMKPHRILAINRGERENILEINFDVDNNAATALVQKKYELHNEYYKTAIEDGIKRLLSPAIIREIRGDQEEIADEHSITIFSTNLKNLLLQQPIKGTRVLGIDPGIRTGSKCACLDDTGKYLGSFVIYNHKAEEAKREILKAIRLYDVQLIAVGSGTGTQEVQNIVTAVIADNSLSVLYTVVDEEGASVYSASDIAREEFPDLDVTIRGAISIGRRLQDPLAELVKIEPKAIGVGLYQHDVNQERLSKSLDEVVSSVVNNVGVNLNTASSSLLRYVSGINNGLAHKIVKYREERGKIQNRHELLQIPGMGPKSFEQCAGFLKIPESLDPLDNTWVHPENYAIARQITETLTRTNAINSVDMLSLKNNYGIGDTTITDIVNELKRPGRDPREEYPKPPLQKSSLSFEDLREGMKITGKIKNVVDFGAFVDLGVKETALVHISEISDRFVKDPFELVKVGDVLEFYVIAIDHDRRRISLSRKSERPAENQKQPVPKVTVKSEEQKTVTHTQQVPSDKYTESVAAQKKPRQTRAPYPDHKPNKRSPKDDDGTMYNPFAELLKDRIKKE